MKIILFILIFIIQAEAVILIYPNGKKEYFIPKVEKSKSLSNKVYYKNGLVSKKTQYEDTREIYISFGEKKNLAKFLNKYNLKLLKTTNEKFYTSLFEIKDNSDVISLCSKINKNEKVRYAKPNWKAPK